MSRWSEQRGHLRLRLAALVLCLGILLAATDAQGASPSLGGETTWELAPEAKGPPAPEKKGPPGPKGKAKKGRPKATSPVQAALADAGSGSGILGDSGQVDPIAGLGMRNPMCDRPEEIHSKQVRLNCEESGTPEGKYPISHYGFDAFIDGGIDSPGGIVKEGFIWILVGIWIGLLYVLDGVLMLLGLAFGLNPFSDGKAMHDIAAALDRVYRTVTNPWLSVTVVAGGIWFAYKGLLRREFAASVSGTLAGIAMLIVGLWVVHQPAESVGWIAKLSDRAAVTVISAPHSGSLARPTGTYAEAMDQVWDQLTAMPFAGLNFSDAEWAMGPPPPEAVKRADEKFCDDAGALALLAILADFGSEQAAKACTQFARKRYGRPKRVIDLYLRSSPGSPSRKALWQYFDTDEADLYKAKVAAQGGDGILTRFSMLVLFAVGLLGVLMLLMWLAIRLFTQASIAFVLLLAAPFAVFFPLLGDSGRKAFKTWGLTLLGATVAKLVYAAFLSVVLLGMSILGGVGGATGFLLTCAFAWAVFLKRAELVGWMSIGDAEIGRAVPPLANFMATSATKGAARRVTGSAGGVARRTAGAAKQRWSDGSEATKETAKGSLAKGARGLADTRHREAQKTVARYEAEHGAAPSSASAPKPEQREAGSRSSGTSHPAQPGAAAAAADTGGGGAAPSVEETQRYERAKRLLDRVKDNEEQTGQPWSDKDLQRFAAENRKQLLNSNNPLDHAHRANYERAELEELKGERRQQAEQEIRDATERDRKRLDVASETPGRVVGRGRRATERARQFNEGAGGERAAALERLRRERREAKHLYSRRNMSRGS